MSLANDVETIRCWYRESNDPLPPPLERVLNALEHADEQATALRRALWLRHGCPFHALYGDDGEMQCATCLIDFKREPIEQISQKWEERARVALEQHGNCTFPCAECDSVGEAEDVPRSAQEEGE